MIREMLQSFSQCAGVADCIPRSDHRAGAGHGLRLYKSQPLFHAGQNQHVATAHQFLKLALRNMRSPLSPCKAPYICARIRVSPATCPSTPFSIPPVKPCRRRRHFSPQTRVNRFVFLNLPILSLGNHLGVTVSPQFPLPAGYVTLPVDSRLPPLGLMLPHSRKQARHTPSFLNAFRADASPISRGEAHCT